MNMTWFWNKCRRHSEALSLLAAGGPAEAEQTELRAHLDGCPGCRARLAELVALSGELNRLGETLPRVEPSASLRGRWAGAVRESVPAGGQLESAGLPAWFSGPQAAWGSLVAIWALALFFRFSGPDAPRPASVAVATPSLREAVLVLKVEPRESPFWAGAGKPVPRQPQRPDGRSPRSQCPISPWSTNLKTT